MKNVLLALGMMLMAGVGSAQNLRFDETEYRFPAMRETDKEAAHKFTFVNKSSNAVQITGVVYSQKNIRITWAKDTIGKKENGAIIVTVNPKNSVGNFDCAIKISTLEKGKPQQYTLRVTGDVLEREKSIQEVYAMKEGNLRYKTLVGTRFYLVPSISAGSTC